MIKSIIKEVCIIILLIIAIVLILGIVFYDYNPTNKKVPNEAEAYVLSEEMQEELNETIKATETQNIVKVYQVDKSDLTGYEKSKDYDKGKRNPFEKMPTEVDNTNSNNANSNSNNSGISNNNSNSSSNTNQENESQGSFLNTIK